MGLVGVAHGWQTLRLFPSWQSLTDEQPVISVDHAIHLYHGYLGARFLWEHGTSWGYDPFFMAGYPKTPVYDSSSGPAELFELMAGAVYSPRAYKWGIALLVALVLPAIVLAAWAYGSRPAAMTTAAAWCLWYWWVGFPDGLVRTGLVAFVWSSALAVLMPALWVRWGQRPNTATWLALSIATAAGIQAHSIFPLMVSVPVATAYCGLAGERTWPWHIATVAAIALALAATCFWWWPFLRFLPFKTGSALFMKAPYWSFIKDYYWDSWRDARVPLLLLVFGTIGLVDAWCGGRRLSVAGLVSQIALLTLLTFAGSMWQVTQHLEPLRFQVPLGLAWCVPAGQGVCRVVATLDPRAWMRSRRAKLRAIGAAALMASVLLLTSGSGWFAGQDPRNANLLSTWQVSWQRVKTARPLSVGLKPEMEQLVAWIERNTDPSARILFEDQLRLLEPTEAESLHWTPLLPLLTGREFVGGLYHLAFIPHQRAAFGDWHLAGRHIRSWTGDELRAFCDQYNIGWVVTWSRASAAKERGRPLSADVFASMPFCEWMATLPRHTGRPDENRYTVFRVEREHSFLARGRGRLVRADYNRLELSDLEPQDGELVLRYHWLDDFRSDPPLPLERAEEPGDPVGFIRVRTDKPLPTLVLWNGYR